MLDYKGVNNMTDEFLTIDDIVNMRTAIFDDIAERFRKYLDTVPDEHKEAVVEYYLDKLLAKGWITKEFRDKVHYNEDYYKGDDGIV